MATCRRLARVTGLPGYQRGLCEQGPRIPAAPASVVQTWIGGSCLLPNACNSERLAVIMSTRGCELEWLAL